MGGDRGNGDGVGRERYGVVCVWGGGGALMY